MINEPSMKLGTINGLEIRIKPSAVLSSLLMAAGFFVLLRKALKWSPAAALSGGLLATLAHYLSEFWHQFGHARFAEETGFPMQGVTLTGPIGVSIYPSNEGLLPAETHIQRALGGPIFSALLALLSGLSAWLLQPIGGLPLAITAFTFLDNLLVFTLGAFLPLGFTDGSTILHWWDRRRGGQRVFVG